MPTVVVRMRPISSAKGGLGSAVLLPLGSVLGFLAHKAEQHKHEKRDRGNRFSDAGVKLPRKVEPVDQRDQSPEDCHAPMEGPAFVIMLDEPERQQSDQDEE